MGVLKLFDNLFKFTDPLVNTKSNISYGALEFFQQHLHSPSKSHIKLSCCAFAPFASYPRKHISILNIKTYFSKKKKHFTAAIKNFYLYITQLF